MGSREGAYHDQPLGDVLRAPMAGLAVAGPVVLLAEQLPILLIVLVRKGGAAVTAPGGQGEGQVWLTPVLPPGPGQGVPTGWKLGCWMWQVKGESKALLTLHVQPCAPLLHSGKGTANSRPSSLLIF